MSSQKKKKKNGVGLELFLGLESSLPLVSWEYQPGIILFSGSNYRHFHKKEIKFLPCCSGWSSSFHQNFGITPREEQNIRKEEKNQTQNTERGWTHSLCQHQGMAGNKKLFHWIKGWKSGKKMSSQGGLSWSLPSTPFLAVFLGFYCSLICWLNPEVSQSSSFPCLE